MSRPRPLALALAVFLLAVSSAAADSPLEPPDPSKFLRWGPVRVRPGFAVPAIGYDDNVFSRSETSDAQGDYVLRLEPRLEGLVFLGPSAFLTFKERFDYTAYLTFTDQNYYENRFESRAVVPFARWGVFGELDISRLRDLPASELDTRPIRRELKTGAGLILEAGWRTDAEIAYFESHWTNFDDEFVPTGGFTFEELNDRVERGPRLKVRYRLTGITRATLEAQTRDVVFDEPAVKRDSTEWAILPGLEFGEGGTLSRSVKIGKAEIDAKDDAAPDFSGPVGSLALAYRLTSATRLRLEAWRRVSFATYEGFRYYQDDSALIRAVHYMNRIFGLEAAVGRGQLEFPGATGSVSRVDDLTRYEAGVRFRLPESVLGRTTEYTLGVRNVRRDSTIDSLDMSRTVVAFGASVGF